MWGVTEFQVFLKENSSLAFPAIRPSPWESTTPLHLPLPLQPATVSCLFRKEDKTAAPSFKKPKKQKVFKLDGEKEMQCFSASSPHLRWPGAVRISTSHGSWGELISMGEGMVWKWRWEIYKHDNLSQKCDFPATRILCDIKDKVMLVTQELAPVQCSASRGTKGELNIHTSNIKALLYKIQSVFITF